MKKTIFGACLGPVLGIFAQSQEIFEMLRKGDILAAKALVEKAPQVLEARDGCGRTPLHYAASGGNAELVEFFTDKGAKLESRDAQSRRRFIKKSPQRRRDA